MAPPELAELYLNVQLVAEPPDMAPPETATLEVNVQSTTLVPAVAPPEPPTLALLDSKVHLNALPLFMAPPIVPAELDLNVQLTAVL